MLVHTKYHNNSDFHDSGQFTYDSHTKMVAIGVVNLVLVYLL